MGKLRILLAEDHILVREGTRGMLEREPDLEVVGEAGDGEQAVSLAERLKPDVAIVDIAMPKLDGIQATKEIKKRSPSTAVLVLTAYDDDEYVFALLEAGAEGYLLKNARSSELIDAIRAVHAGQSVLHPRIARKVVDRYLSPARKPGMVEELTERELEVLKLAAKGMGNKEIAAALFLSVRTVQGHMSNIMSKMGVSSRTEAVMRGLKERLFTLDELY